MGQFKKPLSFVNVTSITDLINLIESYEVQNSNCLLYKEIIKIKLSTHPSWVAGINERLITNNSQWRVLKLRIFKLGKNWDFLKLYFPEFLASKNEFSKEETGFQKSLRYVLIGKKEDE